MDNRMSKVQYNDCVLYITDRDLNDVLLNGPAYPVVQKPYLEVQMENWYSADFPEGVEDVGQMLNFLCDKLFNMPPAMRDRSHEDVYNVVPAVWLTFGELPPALEKEAIEEGFDQDDDMRYLVYKLATGEETFTTSECIMRSDGFWHGTYGVSNTAGQGVLDLHSDHWLLALIG